MLHFNRKNWRPHGRGFPTEKKLGRWPANAALARAHTATRLQLGFAEISEIFKAPKGDVLATANDGGVVSKNSQLIAKRKYAVHLLTEAASTIALCRYFPSAIGLASRCKTGDLAFDKCRFDTADTGRLAGAKYICDRRLLVFIDCDKSVIDRAAEQS